MTMPLLCLTMSARAKLRCRRRLGCFLSTPFICFATLSDIVRKNPIKYTTMAYLGKALFLACFGIANERIRPNDGHAQRKSQASHALACGTTVSRRIWCLPGAAKPYTLYFFQPQRNWRKILNKIRQSAQTENRFACCYGKTGDRPC